MTGSISRSRVAFRRVQLLAGAALAGLVAGGAHAQTAAASVDELVVTGSRIARPIQQSASPILVLSSGQLQAQGQENLADILSQQPQFSAAFGQSRTQSTLSSPAASGLNVVNLRNLGATRSLVLINGRRAPSGTIGSSAVVRPANPGDADHRRRAGCRTAGDGARRRARRQPCRRAHGHARPRAGGRPGRWPDRPGRRGDRDRHGRCAGR